MASIRKKRSSQFWHACITLPNGKQKQFSTGLTDKKEALAVASAAERVCRKQVIPHQLRYALSRLADDFVPADDAEVASWLRSWADGKRGEVAESTLVTYRRAVDDFLEYAEKSNVSTFSQIDTQCVRDWRESIVQHLSPSSANKKFKILRHALGDAAKAKIIGSNPCAAVPRLKSKKSVRREFRKIELDLLLSVLTGEWRGISLLSLYTSQRLNDLAILRQSQLDLVQKTITFHAAKTDRLVCLPLMDDVVDCLLEQEWGDDPDACVFPAIAKLAAPSRSNAFRKILAKVGLAKKIPNKSSGEKIKSRSTSELSFHSLRHSTITMLKAAGTSEGVAMAIAGHSSPQVSAAYTHIDIETMRSELEKIKVGSDG